MHSIQWKLRVILIHLVGELFHFQQTSGVGRHYVLHASSKTVRHCFAKFKTKVRTVCIGQCSLSGQFEDNQECHFASYRAADSLCELCGSQGVVQQQLGWETWERLPEKKLSDCSEWFDFGRKASGVYDIYPRGDGHQIAVFCDMETDGGGWTVFQRRQDGSQDFYLSWSDYKKGFGSLNGEFWLGNDNIHSITNRPGTSYELRIDLEDFENATVFAKYSRFSVGSEVDKYRLTVVNFNLESTGGEALLFHNNCNFTTKDADNDLEANGNCAMDSKGAWWYNNCHRSNLNGRYFIGWQGGFGNGVNWEGFRGRRYSLKSSEMKIRPVPLLLEEWGPLPSN